MTVDADGLAERLAEVNRYIGMHAGGITLERATSDGQLAVRFTGMCTGCLYREATMATTIRPALLQIDGVTSVEAIGARVSAAASARLAKAHSAPSLGLPRWNSGPGDGSAQAVAPDDREPPPSRP